jgi:hypothetical protein
VARCGAEILAVDPHPGNMFLRRRADFGGHRRCCTAQRDEQLLLDVLLVHELIF